MQASYKKKNNIKAVFHDVVDTLCRFFVRNLNNFANAMIGTAPFVFIAFGEWQYSVRENFAIGGEYLVVAPLWVFVVVLLKTAAKRNNMSNSFPIPTERFTTIKNNEVSVRYDQINDLLLYVADLEEWLEKEGYTNG